MKKRNVLLNLVIGFVTIVSSCQSDLYPAESRLETLMNINESNMKKILFMIMTVLGWINLTSCNDYLDIVPKGNKIPTTLDDF